MIMFGTALLLLFSSATAFAPHGSAGREPSLLKPPTQFLPFTPSMESIVSTADLRPFTMLHMSDDKNEPSGEEELDIEEILKVIRETTTEGADIAAAEALIKKEAGLAKLPIPISQSVVRKPGEEVSIQNLNACDEAVIGVTVNALGLILTLSGVPNSAIKESAKRIATLQFKQNATELTRIILNRFLKVDVVSVAIGQIEILGLLVGSFGGIGGILDIIFSEMSWLQIITSTIAITAQLTLIFVSGSAYLAVLLAVAMTDVVNLVDAALTMDKKCTF